MNEFNKTNNYTKRDVTLVSFEEASKALYEGKKIRHDDMPIADYIELYYNNVFYIKCDAFGQLPTPYEFKATTPQNNWMIIDR